MGTTTLVLIVAIVTFGAFVQGLSGFGLALVTVPLLSFLVDAKVAVPIAATFGWLVTFPLVWQLRSHVEGRFGLLLFAGSVPASFIGARLLADLPESWILGAMGIVLVVSGVYTLMNREANLGAVSTGATVATGFASGLLGASVGEPGPPAIAYVSMQPWSADRVKATLSFFFMLQMVAALAGFWNEGLFTGEVGRAIGWAFPGFLLAVRNGF